MGIKFRCHGCDHKLHVKAFLAGKKGVCPHCGAKVRIPRADERAGEGAGERGGRTSNRAGDGKSARATAAVESESKSEQAAGPASPAGTDRLTSASAKPAAEERAAEESDPISEAPEAVWYVRPPNGGQYGPADGEIMRRWLNEGRIGADSLVWREGWSDWETGDSAFSSLQRIPSGADVPVSDVPAASEQPRQEEFVFADGKAVTKRAKQRLPSKSKGLGMAILITLSLVCVALLVGLLFVLN